MKCLFLSIVLSSFAGLVLAQNLENKDSENAQVQKTQTTREGAAPQIGGGFPPPRYMLSPPPPIRYCGVGEVINCKQLGAADNGATVRGHTDESTDQADTQ